MDIGSCRTIILFFEADKGRRHFIFYIKKNMVDIQKSSKIYKILESISKYNENDV